MVEKLVVQGWVAGGHGRCTVATRLLLPAIVRAEGPLTPVIAGAGIADALHRVSCK